MTGWAFFPGFRPLGMLLLLAAALNLLRLARWRGGATLAETSAPMAGHHQSAASWHFVCEALTEAHRPGSYRSDHFGLSLASTPSTTGTLRRCSVLPAA
jgi:hypothetical protein